MNFDDLMFTRSYDRWRPYFQSKLANLLFTAELDRRLKLAGHNVLALTAHPGASRTGLGTESRGFTNKAMKAVAPLVTQSADRGAEPALRAATDLNAMGGEFYGPKRIARGSAVVRAEKKHQVDAPATMNQRSDSGPSLNSSRTVSRTSRSSTRSF